MRHVSRRAIAITAWTALAMPPIEAAVAGGTPSSFASCWMLLRRDETPARESIREVLCFDSGGDGTFFRTLDGIGRDQGCEFVRNNVGNSVTVDVGPGRCTDEIKTQHLVCDASPKDHNLLCTAAAASQASGQHLGEPVKLVLVPRDTGAPEPPRPCTQSADAGARPSRCGAP